MGTLILLGVIVLLVVVVSGLVNISWNENARTKLDSVKRERFFWLLIGGYKGIVRDINAIFSAYLDQNLMSYVSGSKRTDDDEVIKLISEKRGIENINIINDALKNRDEAVRKILTESSQTLAKAEVKKTFDAHEENQIIVAERYEELVGAYMRYLPDEPIKLEGVWDARKQLAERVGHLEWKNGDNKVDLETMFALKKSEYEVSGVIADLLCRKVSDNSILQKNLKQIEQLEMLKWCIVDYNVGLLGTNGLQRSMWRGLANFAG